MGIYVQYGCGDTCPQGWINFDASPTLRLQRLPLIGRFFRPGSVVFPDNVRFGDAARGLPIADGSAEGVYASHVLEHLSLEDFGLALHDTFRILKPGGIFRLVVPDLEIRARRYLTMIENGDGRANAWLMRVCHLGMEKRPRGLRGLARALFGHSAHLWMWDRQSMTEALRQAGFVKFNDSADPAFLAVEDKSRFSDATVGADECAIEARKPAV
jgi:hypothetical protein